MKIDRRITNGLAWAGVALVIGVPTADLLSAQFLGDAKAGTVAEQVAVVAPVAPMPAPLSQRPAAPVVAPSTEVAVAKPVAPVVTQPAAQPAPQQTAGVVDKFLQSGKALPSYITEAGAAPAQAVAAAPVRTPIVTTPATQAAPVAVDPVQVASIPVEKVAPVPMPLSMRPRPVIATTVPAEIVLPPEVLPPEVLSPVAPTVTAADLEDWETGPLSEFLARKQGQGSSATVTTDYDPNGFFLDQGPNPRNRDRVIGWEEQGLPYFSD